MSEHQPDSQEPTDGTASADRRRAERHACGLVPLQAEWDGDPTATRVHDISTTGLCLMTPDRVRPGSVIVLKLLDEACGLSRPLLVRIIHSTRHPEGYWLSGGAFVRRLGDSELEAILAAGRTPGHGSQS